MVVRDRGAPGARLVELQLPDGRTVRIAETLCGWASPRDPDVVWPTVADAVRALTGRSRDGESWIAVLEEFATSGAAPRGEPLAPEDEARLEAVLSAGPTVVVDGPRAQHGGGWYMFVGGLPGGGWVLGHGETPQEAAWAALARAEDALQGPGGRG